MRTTVLVVDDEPEVADRFATRLRDDYPVRTAYSGRAALEALDADVDVVLLDRRMPDLSGREVLDRIRAEGYDCQVAMVTAVNPDLDVLEMPFDDYLTKPVRPDELRSTVDRLSTRSRFDNALQEYTSLVAKRAVLRREMDDSELAESDDFHELTARIERLGDRVDETIDELDDEDAFAVVGDSPGVDQAG